jgi:hypothetical protein
MKRKITSVFIALLLVVMAVFFVSCKDGEVLPVAIDLTNATVEEGTTLLDIMEDLKEEKSLTFEIVNGMITSINGTANSITYNPCWMLYTSDDDPTISNSAWGTYEYKGQTLASAALGADSLPVKSGEIYVWVYVTF